MSIDIRMKIYWHRLDTENLLEQTLDWESYQHKLENENTLVQT